MKARQIGRLEWLIGLIVIVLSVAVWWQTRRPLDGELLVYDVFPLFGLVAFGLMWTHFISGALKRLWSLKESSKSYHLVSSYVVLACIIAHPVLLWWVLWLDDFGLPPMSQYLAYGGTLGLNAALFVGPIALTLFLAYELKRWLMEKSWWSYIEALQLLAMMLIFIHGLSLGGELASGWFVAVWWLYGLSLLIAAIFSMYHDITRKEGAYAINIEEK